MLPTSLPLTECRAKQPGATRRIAPTWLQRDAAIRRGWVRPFTGPGGKWQVSTRVGNLPTWSRNRKELFYREAVETLMVAPCAAEGDSFRAEKPRPLSPGRVPLRAWASGCSTCTPTASASRC